MARSTALAVRGGERDSDDLAALAGDDQGAVPAFEAHVLDVGSGCLRHPQPVERQQRDQRVLGGRAEADGDQERADLVAVQGGGVRLVVQSRPTVPGAWRAAAARRDAPVTLPRQDLWP
jgi:hypothetical protein